MAIILIKGFKSVINLDRENITPLHTLIEPRSDPHSVQQILSSNLQSTYTGLMTSSEVSNTQTLYCFQ